MDLSGNPPNPKRKGRLPLLIGAVIGGVALASLIALGLMRTRPIEVAVPPDTDPTSRRVSELLEEIRRPKFEGQGRPTSYVVRDIAALGSAALPALEQASATGTILVRLSAVEAMGQIGDPNSLPTLSRILKSRELVNIRIAAARAMGRIGDRSAVPDLLAAIQEPESYIRWNAAIALGEIGDPNAAPALILALTDADTSVRSFSAASLGQIKDTRAVQPLIAALKDPETGVRFSAARSLGTIGDGNALPALRAALGDLYVREEAAKAISRIEGASPTSRNAPP
jgi:HEAT repeat protein